MWPCSPLRGAASGTTRAQGTVYLAAGSSLGSVLGAGAQPPANPGTMIVEGRAEVFSQGATLSSGYKMNVAPGGNLVLDPGTFMVADRGTSTTIQAGGVMSLTGDGGYYPGAAVAGQPASALVNNGVLRKSGGTGVSVIDANLSGAGSIEVQSATLALPDTIPEAATVSPGSTLATGRCDPASPTTICQPSANPAVDPMSVGFTLSAGSPSTAVVQLQELGATTDAAQVGNEVLAHADGLAQDTTHPARLALRFSQADVMATPVDQVQVVHTTDNGQDVLLPDCAAGALPSGLYSCIQRPVTRDAQNTYVTVLTVTTSRWHLRRGLPVANQGAPTAPQNLKVAVGDGSALKVSWVPPASPGAGPVSSYRVTADGKTKATTSGTSAVVKNLGPGKHAIRVVAVNAAGPSPTVATEPQAGQALQAPQGQGRARRRRRPAHGEGDLEGTGGRWRLRHQALPGRRPERQRRRDRPQGRRRQQARARAVPGRRAVPLPGPRQEQGRLRAVEQEDRPGPAPLTPPAPDSSAVSRVFPRSAAQTNRCLTAARGP